MAAPSSRMRSKIALTPSRIASTSLSVELTVRLVFSNVLLAAALDAGKDLLLPPDARLGVFWVLIRVLACAALGALVREGITGDLGKKVNERVEWSVVGMAGLLLFVQQAALLTMLYRISALRVVLFTHFASFWVDALIHRDSVQKTIVLLLAFVFSFLSDANFTLSNIRFIFPGYAALVVYGLATSGLDHTQGVLSPSLGRNATRSACIIGATVIALPFYIFKTLISNAPETPAVPLSSLIALPVLAFSLLFLSPNTTAQVRSVALPTQHYPLSYATTALAALILGPLAFSQYPSWTDCLAGVLLFYGAAPDKEQTLSGPPRTPATRLAKAYLKIILANPESRKIFYFLVLNLAYMLVQMLYGVWTNSLGLISDAIHMAFDCMAIGMGLLASVMATWPPNERFTYGYGRIETLSGFANGIFLILISIFIVFEAIQRILDPPEMNTNQLLLVSTLGLGVNLFGMFAMGGHHHHGHSHSHGHSHGGDEHSHGSHSSPTSPHAHTHSSELRVNGADGHNHSHDHDHGHAPQNTSPTPTVYLSPEVCNDDHDHGHTHSHAHHDHEHNEDHSHGHDHGHGLHYASPTFASAGHAHTLPPPNAPPMSAPATTARFHARTMSLQVPGAGILGSSSAHGPGHSGPRGHARAPSVAPPSSAGLLTPETFNSPGSPDSVPPVSPLTPSYEFGQDAHFASAHHTHDGGAHVPNLHDHRHAHHGGGEHEGHSHNMRGVFLHVMADTLGSVGVIISTLLIQFYGWTGFDPIASLFIAVLIVASVVPLVIDSGKVLCLDVGERASSIEQALAELESINGLASYSAPRFWPKDDSSLIGSIHIQLAPAHASVDPAGPHASVKRAWAPVDRVMERVDTMLRNRISGLEELTIQVEGSDAS